jgi:signal transduction histidine kinase
MRIALVAAALFLVGGSLLVGVTYQLVAHSLSTTTSVAEKDATNGIPKGFRETCDQARLTGELAIDPSFNAKCKAIFALGEQAGASTQRARALDRLLRYSLAVLAAVTLIAGIVGWLIAGRLLRPLKAITATARRAGEEHLGERLRLAGPRDELRELADTFDDMLDRLDASFDSQRRFVANASHELRTPLTVMRTTIDVTLAKPGLGVPELTTMASDVRNAVEQAEALIEALLTLAASDRGIGPADQVDLATAAEDAIDAAGPLLRQRDTRLTSGLEPALVHGDAVLLERLAANLVDNASRHNVAGGWIRVATCRRGGTAMLEVANSCEPIGEDDLPRLFEPFHRLHGRVAGGGVGLGLSIVRSVVTAHGGTVRALPLAGGGLTVTVEIPAAHGDHTEAAADAKELDPLPQAVPGSA